MIRVKQNRKIETASNSASTYTGGITIKSPHELDMMRRAGAIVGSVLSLLRHSVAEGMTTKDLDRIAYKEITRHGAKPTFKGYRGFPSSICTSINEDGMASSRSCSNNASSKSAIASSITWRASCCSSARLSGMLISADASPGL